MCDILRKKAQRVFRPSWIGDERFKTWIHKVSAKSEIYYCTMCEKEILCSTHPSKHATSAKHKFNVKNKRINSDFCHSCAKKSGKVLFKKSWLEFELFKPWLREVPSDQYSFFCLVCEKTMSAHLSHIYRHAESSSHVKAMEAYAAEIMEEKNREEEINAKPSCNERKKKANLKYAQFIAEKKIPFHIAAEFLSFFQEMSKDPITLQSMRMGRLRCNSVVSHVLYTIETKCEPDQQAESS